MIGFLELTRRDRGIFRFAQGDRGGVSLTRQILSYSRAIFPPQERIFAFAPAASASLMFPARL
jgi:hypothetical protein